MAPVKIDIGDIEQFVGREIGTSDWMEVSQSRVNKFAEATGDFQWIHVDVERANRELPQKTTIIHGYLTLSLVPQFFDQIVEVTGLRYGLNYGTNKLRFLSPVPTGSQLRMKLTLSKIEQRLSGDSLLTFDIVMEVREQNHGKPVMVLEMLAIVAPKERSA